MFNPTDNLAIIKLGSGFLVTHLDTCKEMRMWIPDDEQESTYYEGIPVTKNTISQIAAFTSAMDVILFLIEIYDSSLDEDKKEELTNMATDQSLVEMGKAEFGVDRKKNSKKPDSAKAKFSGEPPKIIEQGSAAEAAIGKKLPKAKSITETICENIKEKETQRTITISYMCKGCGDTRKVKPDPDYPCLKCHGTSFEPIIRTLVPLDSNTNLICSWAGCFNHAIVAMKTGNNSMWKYCADHIPQDISE